jgi:hypothetical protein
MRWLTGRMTLPPYCDQGIVDRAVGAELLDALKGFIEAQYVSSSNRMSKGGR